MTWKDANIHTVMKDAMGVTPPPWTVRRWGLMDLDAFFASVEMLDHPEWRGKPLIVGGDADSRGVVSTCSYEARRFGVHSAMASAEARRLCPQAIWTHGHFDRYREVSAQVMAILADETPRVERVSIDEAFTISHRVALRPKTRAGCAAYKRPRGRAGSDLLHWRGLQQDGRKDRKRAG